MIWALIGNIVFYTVFSNGVLSVIINFQAFDKFSNNDFFSQDWNVENSTCAILRDA